MMRCAHALPITQLMPAASSRKHPVATPLLGGLPGKIERPHPSVTRTPGTPSIIMSPDPLSVDPGKAGRRHARRVFRTTTSHGRQQMT
jgi:hypothetical protein